MTLLSTLVFAALQSAPTHPEIAFELQAMVMADQEVRTRWVEASKKGQKLTIGLVLEMQSVDRENTTRLKSYIVRYGWLTPTVVGKQAAHDAWLLVQHADLDPKFQERCLRLMEPFLGTGRVSKQDYAYLFDRVACAQKKPQRFGTQFEVKDGKLILKETEDPKHLDQRRKKMGMMPMAAYRKLAEEMYGGKK